MAHCSKTSRSPIRRCAILSQRTCLHAARRTAARTEREHQGRNAEAHPDQQSRMPQRADALSSILTGIPGHAIEDVKFSNIYVENAGGGAAEAAKIVPPELEEQVSGAE